MKQNVQKKMFRKGNKESKFLKKTPRLLSSKEKKCKVKAGEESKRMILEANTYFFCISDGQKESLS